MKIIGLDTCVVVRLLVGEPEDQAAKAHRYVEKCYYDGIGVYVSDMVVAEAYYALLYHYKVPEKKVVDTLQAMLSSPMITMTDHAVSVLSEYRGKGAGLVDRLIRMNILEQAHEVVTFDKEFARLQNVHLIK